jgi:hypothetical protein
MGSMLNKSQKITNMVKKRKYLIKSIIKWWIIYSISLFFGAYILKKLVILNPLLNLIFIALIVTIVAQAIKSHEFHKNIFKFKRFIFYFLVYANVIWLIGKFIFPETILQAGPLSFIFLGFVISIVVQIVKKLKLRDHTINWLNFLLLLLLIVANSEYLALDSIQSFMENTYNTSSYSEEKQLCPMPQWEVPVIISTAEFNPENINQKSIRVIDNSIWRIENRFGTCYMGKYRGQHPDWYYCDDMIVSRWDTGSSGTINHRWYTAISAEWNLTDNNVYEFNGFKCENGQKVTVDKDETNYYVHVTKDGTELKIEY